MINALLAGHHFCITRDGRVVPGDKDIKTFRRECLFFVCDWPDESRAVFEDQFFNQVYDLRVFEQATLGAIL